MVGRLGIEVGSMGEQPLRARGYMERRAAFGVTRKNFHTVTNWLLLRQPDDEALKCISMRIDQMLRCLSDCPNQVGNPVFKWELKSFCIIKGVMILGVYK